VAQRKKEVFTPETLLRLLELAIEVQGLIVEMQVPSNYEEAQQRTLEGNLIRTIVLLRLLVLAELHED